MKFKIGDLVIAKTNDAFNGQVGTITYINDDIVLGTMYIVDLKTGFRESEIVAFDYNKIEKDAEQYLEDDCFEDYDDVKECASLDYKAEYHRQLEENSKLSLLVDVLVNHIRSL